jgi:hypothetical protein
MHVKSLIVAVSALSLTATAAHAVTLEFDQGLSTGQEFTAGETFTTEGVEFTVSDFVDSGGGTTSDLVRVSGTNQAGGFADELQIDNVTIEPEIEQTLDGLSLMYGEFGGNLNLEINGDFRNFDNFADIHQTSVGGTNVFTGDVGTPGDSRGFMTVTGEVDQFALGGQELYVDNVVSSIPEPTSVALLGLGSVFMVTGRRRRRA